VMLVCKSCGVPTKTNKVILENGQKIRACKKCNETIDVLLEPKDMK
jgi:large subunit ribosomal protein L24